MAPPLIPAAKAPDPPTYNPPAILAAPVLTPMTGVELAIIKGAVVVTNPVPPGFNTMLLFAVVNKDKEPAADKVIVLVEVIVLADITNVPAARLPAVTLPATPIPAPTPDKTIAPVEVDDEGTELGIVIIPVPLVDNVILLFKAEVNVIPPVEVIPLAEAVSVPVARLPAVTLPATPIPPRVTMEPRFVAVEFVVFDDDNIPLILVTESVVVPETLALAKVAAPDERVPETVVLPPTVKDPPILLLVPNTLVLVPLSVMVLPLPTIVLFDAPAKTVIVALLI